jgi:2,3-bisphosphoglycerate-dependent phosphoglycerate mutase
MAVLILLRHGQSMWNERNLFTGWVNIPLSKKGIDEAIEAGKKIAHLPIHIIYTSTLMRAQQTAMIAMAQHHSNKVPIIMPTDSEDQIQQKIYSPEISNTSIPTFIDWRLNERQYGELQGLNKAKTAEKFGDEQVKLWRRSYDIAPPSGESLAMTKDRTLPCLRDKITPLLDENKNVLISAHGNSLRSIIMSIENLSETEILNFELPTGVPRIYQYESGSYTFKPE